MKKRLLPIVLIGCIVLTITGCSNNSSNNSQTKNTEYIESADKNTIPYNEKEHTLKEEIKLGNDEIGYLTLNTEYKTEDVSQMISENSYYMATNNILGISFLNIFDTLDNVIAISQNTKGYSESSIENIKETETHAILKIHAKNPETKNLSSTGIIYDKNKGMATIIIVANFVEMEEQDFKLYCDEIFKTHSFGMF